MRSRFIQITESMTPSRRNWGEISLKAGIIAAVKDVTHLEWCHDPVIVNKKKVCPDDATPEEKSDVKYWRITGNFVGITDGSFVNQEVMDRHFHDVDGIETYIDDTTGGSNDGDEHYDRLVSVISIYVDKGIQLRLERCQLVLTETEFLGRNIGAHGACMAQNRKNAYLNMAAPINSEQVKSVLQSFNYWHNYLPNLAVVTAPLSALVKRKVRFQWEEKEKECWKNIKNLINANLIM
eukprot:Awhi_evm2s11156